MAINVNLLDRAPDLLLRSLNFALAPFEDPIGADRPLWVDVSAYQGQVNYEVLFKNGVLGVAMRAGISWGYQDKWFPANWLGAGMFGLYRTSYHVLYTDQPILKQADNVWYKAQDEIEYIPRVIDLEVDRGDSAQKKAQAVWEMSELVLKRDGLRPIIYSRYLLLNSWLASWTPSMLNEHYYWLAQYLWDRTREHAGPPTLPNRVDRSRVLLHQTADKKAAFPGSCQSYALDRDRWEIGNASLMHQWISETWGSQEPPPPQVPDTLRFQAIDTVPLRSTPNKEAAIVGEIELAEIVDAVDVAGKNSWIKIGDGMWAPVFQEGMQYLVKAARE